MATPADTLPPIPDSVWRELNAEPDDTVYPDSDGAPLAETPIHVAQIVYLLVALQNHFATDPLAYVGANMFLFWLKGQADIAKQALDLFASIYGAEAGNLALKAMTLNGVYLGGGIAPKLLAKLKDGTFMKAFTNKGRYKRLMSSIPVKVVMNQHTALPGAASVAAALSHTPAS